MWGTDKEFFISLKSYVTLSTYSSFCISNDPMIYQICDVMISISTWDRVNFWIFFLNHNSLSHQLGQLIDISKCNNFHKSFEQFGGLGLSSTFFSTCSNYSISNYVKVPVFLKRWLKDNKKWKKSAIKKWRNLGILLF